MVARSIAVSIYLSLGVLNGVITADQSANWKENLPKYLTDFELKIKHQWYPPKIHPLKTAIIRFKLHIDGKATHVVLEKSTKSKLTDEAALNALKNACPAMKFPPGFPKTLDLRLTFDYYAKGKRLELINESGNSTPLQ